MKYLFTFSLSLMLGSFGFAATPGKHECTNKAGDKIVLGVENHQAIVIVKNVNVFKIDHQVCDVLPTSAAPVYLFYALKMMKTLSSHKISTKSIPCCVRTVRPLPFDYIRADKSVIKVRPAQNNRNRSCLAG